jgi:hypothetical protein
LDTDTDTDADTDTDTDGPPPPADSGTDGGLCDGYLDNPPVENYYGELIELSGPFEEEGMCCYDVTYEVQYPCGRPFYVQDRPRVADVAARRDWADRERPHVEGLDTATRQRLATAWLEDALAEHASIASFARFAMQLLALGAPPELLADTHAAMDDELEHARLCFALASAYAGRELGPGTLPIGDALLDALDLEAAVVSAIREGCIGETMAAMQAEVAFGLAGDPAVLRALDRIKRDEAAHAALAWRFVDWAVKSGGNRIREVAREAFERWAPTAAGNTAGPSPDLQRHGRLHDSDLALLQRRTYDEVIRPCANALLAVPVEPELEFAELPA